MWDGLNQTIPNVTSQLFNSTMLGGAPVDDFLKSFNILGMGSEVIAIVLAVLIAVGVTQKDMRNKDYSGTVGIFLMSYVSLFSVGYATSLALLVLFSIVGVAEIVVAEGTKVFR